MFLQASAAYQAYIRGRNTILTVRSDDGAPEGLQGICTEALQGRVLTSEVPQGQDCV